MYLIIDGTNLAHRARYAYRLSHRGKDTSVTYGTMRILLSLIKKYKPSSVIFCWDGGTPGFRRRLVPSYKVGRKAKEDDPTWPIFISQLKELEAILPTTGVLQVKRRGIEADDLAAHAARLALEESLIVSMDKDLLQCVSDNTSVLCPGKNEVLYTFENFKELNGYNTFQHVAYKTLMGDSSDNIPGIRGVGPKTAVKILTGGKVPESTTTRIKAFLASGDYSKAYAAMDLSVDLSGARYALVTAEWEPYSQDIYQWCIQRGFTSLIEGYSFGTLFGPLKKPMFADLGFHFPRIWDYERYPVENPLYAGQDEEI